MSQKVRIAQLSCGPEYSGVQKEIYDAAKAVDAEIFFPDIALADVERAVASFGLDVKSADLKLMIARAMALVEGKVDADGGDHSSAPVSGAPRRRSSETNFAGTFPSTPDFRW